MAKVLHNVPLPGDTYWIKYIGSTIHFRIMHIQHIFYLLGLYIYSTCSTCSDYVYTVHVLPARIMHIQYLFYLLGLCIYSTCSTCSDYAYTVHVLPARIMYMQYMFYLLGLCTYSTCSTCSVAEFKEFERRFKFKPRFKYGWFHLKLYQMFQDLNQRLI